MTSSIDNDTKRMSLNMVRSSLLAMGFDPQCDKCKHFDTEIGTCAVDADTRRFYDGLHDCPQFSVKE